MSHSCEMLGDFCAVSPLKSQQLRWQGAASQLPFPLLPSVVHLLFIPFFSHSIHHYTFSQFSSPSFSPDTHFLTSIFHLFPSCLKITPPTPDNCVGSPTKRHPRERKHKIRVTLLLSCHYSVVIHCRNLRDGICTLCLKWHSHLWKQRHKLPKLLWYACPPKI